MVLRGGTNVKWSPPVDHTRLALLPLLHRMGVAESAISIDLRRRGFYPLGGGQVIVNVDAVQSLRPLCIEHRGDAISVSVVVFARGTARSHAKELADCTRAALQSSSFFGCARVAIEIDADDADEQDRAEEVPNKSKASFEEGCGALTRKQRRAMHLERVALSFGACGVQLVAFGSLGGVISADALDTEDFLSVPQRAVQALEEQWVAGGAVDEHLMDQLVLYMAMASGKSCVVCNGRTGISSQHLETATELTRQITGVSFSLAPVQGVGGAPCVRVECDGLSWLNEPRWQGLALGIVAKNAVVLDLSCDETWEEASLEGLPSEGVVRDRDGHRCRHITLIPMREVTKEIRSRCIAASEQLAQLAWPPISFHSKLGTAVRDSKRSAFFALRCQHRWRQFAAEVASIVGADAPRKQRLFHMSVWNSDNGDPFRSIGDVCVDDFPFDVE